jgi:imidazolonepropionase-like amidohydrolase
MPVLKRNLLRRACLTLLFANCFARGEDVAFVHVNVIPMDRDYVLADQTVLIAGERIREIGPAAKVLIEAGARRIDGSGAFLIPGLCDMHVHFSLPAMHPESYRSLNRNYALQLLASGITTVRNMRGFPELLTLRAEIDSGTVIGPRIYSTGVGNNGGSAIWAFDRKIETAADAKNGVNQDQANGFDAIKVYSGLSATAYGYLVDAARTAGLPVYGHVPHAVALHGVLNERQDSIEHLSGYLEAIQPFQAQDRLGALLRVFRHLDGGHYDAGTLRSVAKATREAGTWNCPTLVLLRSLYTRWRAIPATLAASAPMSPRPGPGCEDTVGRSDPPPFDWQDDRFPLVVVKALHEIGARLLVGTDADGTYVVHGDSIHDELSLFVAAGLTPYEALRASTADPAEFLGKEAEFGTIATGKLANLVLLAGDPRVDIRNANRQIGVMVQGRWFTRQDLEHLLERVR